MNDDTMNDDTTLDDDRLYRLVKHAVNAPHFNRNSYCAASSGDIYRDWLLLCGMGIAEAGPFINDGRDRYFSVTRAGLAFMRALCEGDAR